MSNLVKLIFSIAVLVVLHNFSVSAQINDEIEVKAEMEGSRNYGCYELENSVYNQQKFNELIKNDKCSSLRTLKINFTNKSLIGFRVRGDCFVRGLAKVFRNDKVKTYKIKVNKIWGGCRAGGAYAGWLVIDKIPTDYKIEFTEERFDNWRLFLNATTEEKLETRSIDLKGCIQTYFTKQFVIRDETSYLKAIRNDASRDWCLKNLEKIDFNKNSLLGIRINSGYCRIPLGLKYETLKNNETKQYLFNISYIRPEEVCRHLSQYDIWVLVSKIPKGFAVKFNVRSDLAESKNNENIE